MTKCFRILAIMVLAAPLILSGCSRRGGEPTDDSVSTVWGLQITAIESMTGVGYIESSVNANDLDLDDSAVAHVVNRYPSYWTSDTIDPTYNVTITHYLVQLSIANYPPFSFDKSIHIEIPASTSDTATSINIIVVPSVLKAQIKTIVDAEGGAIDGTAKIRLEGEFGSGQDAYDTGSVSVKFSSKSSS